MLLIGYRLLVGAPAADSGQPGVQEGGAVYKCRPESPNQCEIIPFDREGKPNVLITYLLKKKCLRTKQFYIGNSLNDLF